MKQLLIAAAASLLAQTATAEVIDLAPRPIPQWKSIYGEVEPQDLTPARARLSGTLVELAVSEGDTVEAGQQIGRIEDDKILFQQDALRAQLAGLSTQLDTARADLDRGVSLKERGVITTQRLEQLQTAVDVLENNIKSAEAQLSGIAQQVTEGAILSPVSGIVLDVPVARGSVVNAGENVAMVASGDVFLRLALPERHADTLTVGDPIEVGRNGTPTQGTVVKVYPLISGGRVLADVEVEGLDARFIGRRVPVRLAVGDRTALAVPETAVMRRAGLDFVSVEVDGDVIERTVVPGAQFTDEGAPYVEIISGLVEGDRVIVDAEASHE